MLTTQGETSEAEVLQRIQQARGNGEPAKVEPTAEPEAVNVSEEAPETEAIEEPIGDLMAEESDESEEAGADIAADSGGGDEELWVDLGGREVNLKEISEWEQGNLRQSDYTKKTQALSEERKAFEAERDEFKAKHEQLTASASKIQAIIDQETKTAEEIAELREYDPEAYITYMEKMARLENAASESSSVQPISNVDVNAERKKLWDANPSWTDNGKQTEAYSNDLEMLKAYARDQGYTDADLNGMTESRHFMTMLDAARYKAMSAKNSSIEKRVRKAPVTTKPKQAVKPALHDKIKQAEARLKKTGKSEDAVALRRLKRQLQGN